jgi:hypothetical protein
VLVGLYGATLFVTSALLFFLEPLVAKELLPILGGGSAVWTTAVAFFQAALLAGYLYAHRAPAWLGARRHPFIHVGLLAGVALALPLRAPTEWVAPAQGPALWLFARLAMTVGPAFVLLAATAPLVQRWLASTGAREGRDPYFLYAASNAGSLVALGAYPALIEPVLGLEHQRRAWTIGLDLAVVLMAACAIATWRQARPDPRIPPERDAAPAAPTASARARWGWVVLAAVPSSLLLSVTSYMTTDVVALPLLWVLPLALYLLTFVIAFGRRARSSPRLMVRAQAFLMVLIAAEMFLRIDATAWTLVPLHAVAFFVTALVCHRSLADRRPPQDRVTEFYACVAAGGALGGLFNVFVAPLVFRGLLEYPIGLVLAALLRPPTAPAPASRHARRMDAALPLALGGLLLAGVPAVHAIEAKIGLRGGLAALVVLLAGAGAAGYSFRSRPLRFGLGLAAIMAAGASYTRGSTRVLHAARSFYGTHKVVLEPPTLRTLTHGNTTHGAQDLAPARRREPLTYYHRSGPIGGVMAAWSGRPQRARVAVVGLGAGSLAAYAAPGERWTFYEIDPAVIDIARDRGLFTFLAEAHGVVDVVAGDGRLGLAAALDRTLGLLVLDAFTSDAVPAHLLTREALALYVRKLSAGGLIAIHLSNRYLDLEPVVAGTAGTLGLSSLVRFDNPTEAEARDGKTASHWMVLARTAADLAPLANDARWAPPARVGQGWTDDASHLWGPLRLLGR